MDVAKERIISNEVSHSKSVNDKPYVISRWAVWDAYKQVKANRGSAGIDRQTIAMFDKDLENNLYRIWNRMSSGSYVPPPVLKVEIPKGNGTGLRPLGIPTVSDRIAQMVVKKHIEPKIEPHFHPDSYGYSPGKTALDAVGAARARCWRYNWVIDLDVKGYFDTINHDLLMIAVRKHVGEDWCLLYIERWLRAPSVTRVITRKRNASDVIEESIQTERTIGTPQGGVISPLLANLFLHYMFDAWMVKNYPDLEFARYADDMIVHCRTERQAHFVLSEIKKRMTECGLTVHPEKTKVVYCRDSNRRSGDKNLSCSFEFLGYGFRPRHSRNNKGKCLTNFSPAMGRSAALKVRAAIREWKVHLWTNTSINTIAVKVNPVVRGWIQYYGRYHRSALYPVLNQLERSLAKWVQRTYKHLTNHPRKAIQWLYRTRRETPSLFAHLQLERWRQEAEC